MVDTSCANFQDVDPKYLAHMKAIAEIIGHGGKTSKRKTKSKKHVKNKSRKK